MPQTRFIKNNTRRSIIIGDLNLELLPHQKLDIFHLKTIDDISTSEDIEKLIDSGKVTVFDNNNNPLPSSTRMKNALKVASKDEVTTNEGQSESTTVESNILPQQNILVTTVEELVTAANNANTQCLIQLAAGSYVLTEPLNLTNKTNVFLLGSGKDITIISSTTIQNQPIVDMSGCLTCGLSELTIDSDIDTNNASCGLLIARNSDGDESNRHFFRNIKITGYYNIAALVNVGSDKNMWHACDFNNKSKLAGGTKTLHLSNDEPTNLGSLQTIGSGSIINELFIQCTATRQPITTDIANDVCLYIEGGTINNVNWKYGIMTMKSAVTTRATGQKAVVHIHSKNTNNIQCLCINNSRIDAPAAYSFIHATGDAAASVSMETYGNNIIIAERLVYGDTNITFENSRFKDPNLTPSANYSGDAASTWGFAANGITFDSTGTRAAIDIYNANKTYCDLVGATVDTSPNYSLLVRTRNTSTISRYAATNASHISGPAVGQKIVWS